MPVDRDDVRRIARLARLRLSEAEAETLGRDLNDILVYVDILATVPMDEMSLPDPTRISTPERVAGDGGPDVLLEPMSRYAPDFRDGFFVVPSPPSLGTERAPEKRS